MPKISKISFLNANQIEEELENLINFADEINFIVAWGTQNSLMTNLEQNVEKINCGVWGTHFYQTDPELLKVFCSKKGVRVNVDYKKGVFHPKVYLFKKGHRTTAIVGSSNFTNGGLKKNAEANLLIEIEGQEEISTSITSMITKAWNSAIPITKTFVEDYKVKYKNARKYHKALDKVSTGSSYRNPQSNNNSMTWDKFIGEVSKEQFFEHRKKVMREAQKLLFSTEQFSDLNLDGRRKIAGLYKSSGFDELDWGLFGSMKGAGVFQKLINNNNSKINQALSMIPPRESVSENDYSRFVNLYRQAFNGELRKGGLPTATRLLAIKRPDCFICVSKPNKKALAEAFGCAPSTLSLDNYWDRIIDPMHNSDWYNCERPTGEYKDVWDIRAAMLDGIYYKVD